MWPIRPIRRIRRKISRKRNAYLKREPIENTSLTILDPNWKSRNYIVEEPPGWHLMAYGHKYYDQDKPVFRLWFPWIYYRMRHYPQLGGYVTIASIAMALEPIEKAVDGGLYVPPLPNLRPGASPCYHPCTGTKGGSLHKMLADGIVHYWSENFNNDIAPLANSALYRLTPHNSLSLGNIKDYLRLWETRTPGQLANLNWGPEAFFEDFRAGKFNGMPAGWDASG